MEKLSIQGTGRRKSSIARVRLVPGNGNVTINKKDLSEYLSYETLRNEVKRPLDITDTLSKYDVIATAVSYTHLTLPTKRIV